MSVEVIVPAPWASPLGIGAALFLAYGLFWVVIGVLTPVALSAGWGGQSLFWTSASDAHAFGDPAALIEREPAVLRLRDAYLNTIAALLLAGGLAIAALAAFGVREGARWAAATLTLAGAAVLPTWWLVMRVYLAGGWRFTLADVPPFMWVTTLLWVPAVALTWWGLSR